MKLSCRIWGHKLNEEAAYYYCVWRCDRCGDVYEDECGLREWIKVRKWLALQWLQREWTHWREWWRCGECGGRFGRHDNSYDHLPF